LNNKVHGSKRPLIITTMQELNQDQILNDLTTQDYQYGFTTDVETDVIEKGLNEDVNPVDFIEKGRTRMAARFSTEGLSPLADDEAAQLAHLKIPEIDYQNIIYYADPTKKNRPRTSMR